MSSAVKTVLPASIIAQLYKKVLVATEPESKGSAPAAVSKVVPLSILGNNLKNISILVHYVDSIVIPPEQLEFLKRLLTACSLTTDDVAIFNMASGPQYAGLKQQLQPSVFILFGPDPTSIGLPMSFPPFKPQSYDNCTFLYTPAIDMINRENEEGKLLKSKLWVCLRKIFSI